jgi:hypothetical protein
VIGIEGKANEPLDSRLEGKYAAAAQRKREDKNTNLDGRVDDLLAAIIRKRYSDDPNLAKLRYQSSRRSLERSRPRSQRRLRPPSSST